MVSEQDLLNLDIDLRIGVEVWSQLWSGGRWSRRNHALIAALLRYAYGAGYVAALTEPRRGQLLRDHGIAVPPTRHARNR
jgi:hypothetical protein